MPKPEEKEIPFDVDYTLRPQTPEEKSKNENREIPEYKIQLDLDDDQIRDLTKQCHLEFDALKTERDDLDLENKWEEKDSQYDGDMVCDNPMINFNLDTQETKIVIDAVVRAINESFLPDDGDIIDVSPRPETARKDGFVICEKQSQFIDFAMDEEIKPEIPFIKIAKSAATKFVGIGKLVWSYEKDIRRREECWEAQHQIVGIDPKTQSPIIDRVGLKRFLQSYPDALKRYPKQCKDLFEGKDINIVVKYKEQISNNPELKYINIRDFYVSNSTDYWRGLRTAHCMVERKPYTYYELLKMEKDGEFQNVNALFETSKDGRITDNAMTASYDVLEFTILFKINEDDEEETKIKCWFGEECLMDSKEGYLGAILYPYYAIDTDYIPFYCKVNDDGFYGGCKSIADDIYDSHIAQNAFLNLLLQSLYVRNILTPITAEGSEVEDKFLNGDFVPGQPLSVPELTDDVSKAVDFVNWPNVDTQGSLVLMEKIKRVGRDVTRVSDYQTTGGESSADPSAPARKTAMLLHQSGVGIKDYIRTMLPSFNIFAGNILQMYYQMNTGDRKFRIRQKSKQVTGKDVFDSITRDEMVVNTTIKSKAATFAFDKLVEKREALAAYQTVRQDPYAIQLPMLQYKALKNLLKTFGAKWRAMADTDLPTPDELTQQVNMATMQAIQALFQQAKQKEDVTGVAQDPREVISQAPDAVRMARARVTTPGLGQEEER